MKNRLLLTLCGLFLANLSGVALGYNRDAAVEYALLWSARADNKNVVNTTVYKNYFAIGGNCANFASQCVNAGGIRFRASNPFNNLAPEGKAEFGTGMWTRAIKSDKTELYSRVITGVHNLYNSLKHARHGGLNRYTDDHKKDDGGTIWTHARKVRPGDVILDLYTARAGHTRVVNSVQSGATPKDVHICCNAGFGDSAWRRDVSLNADIAAADWKTTQDFHVICLPDAPRITGTALYTLVGAQLKRLITYWGPGRRKRQKGSAPDRLKKAGKANLQIQINFDCDMKTTEAATVKLMIGQGVSFVALVADGYTNGWRTGATDGSKVKNRTWIGNITAANMPAKKNVLANITVLAKGADGTSNDKDNDLAKYVAGANKFIYVVVDTRAPTGSRR